MDANFPDRLGAADSVMWEMERDPVLRSPILVVGVLDREPEWDRFLAAFDRAARAIPRLNQRVVRSRWRAGHRWVADRPLALEHHVRRMRAPRPGTMRTVLDLAQPILSNGFDRDRPLWECHLVEGVEGERSAFILKLHHAATDGVGGIALAGALFDLSQEGGGHMRGFEALPTPRLRLVMEQLDAMVHVPGRAAGVARRGLTAPVATAQEAARTLRSLGRLLAPIREPLSPVMRGRGLTRHLDVFDLPLADLQRAASAVGGTINDAYLAAVAGGLARYHERLDAPVAALRITMPVNLRHQDDPLGGNRFAPVRFAMPIDVEDPAERIRRVGAAAHEWRDDPAIGWTETIAAAIRLLPPAMAALTLGSMFRAVDLETTNVPGLSVPLWLAGAAVERLHAFAPPTGAAMSVTLLSHMETAAIGVQTDDAAVAEPEAMSACLREGFDQVVSVGSQGTQQATPVAG